MILDLYFMASFFRCKDDMTNEIEGHVLYANRELGLSLNRVPGLTAGCGLRSVSESSPVSMIILFLVTTNRNRVEKPCAERICP